MATQQLTPVGLDALPPPEMARKAEAVGVTKAGLDAATTFALAVLAGAFIAMGAVFATTTTAGAADVPYGIARLLGGLTFSLGLMLVVVAGAELFTGNNLIVMAWASRRVSTLGLLRNWAIVFIPYGLFVKEDGAFVASLDHPPDLSGLTWGSFLGENLVPVTIGNIVGGALMVGAVYWFVYLRKRVDRDAVPGR